jgi:hypothetical protein
MITFIGASVAQIVDLEGDCRQLPDVMAEFDVIFHHSISTTIFHISSVLSPEGMKCSSAALSLSKEVNRCSSVSKQ